MTRESVWHLKVQPWCSSIENRVKYTRWAAFRSLSVSDTVIRQLIEIVSIEAVIRTNNARPTKGKRRRKRMRSSMTWTFFSASLFPREQRTLFTNEETAPMTSSRLIVPTSPCYLSSVSESADSRKDQTRGLFGGIDLRDPCSNTNSSWLIWVISKDKYHICCSWKDNKTCEKSVISSLSTYFLLVEKTIIESNSLSLIMPVSCIIDEVIKMIHLIVQFYHTFVSAVIWSWRFSFIRWRQRKAHTSSTIQTNPINGSRETTMSSSSRCSNSQKKHEHTRRLAMMFVVIQSKQELTDDKARRARFLGKVDRTVDPLSDRTELNLPQS